MDRAEKKTLDKALTELTYLNKSQQDAIKTALRQRISIIQGPPGTGKTTTAVFLIKIFATLFKQTPVLACAFSNVAVDNLMAGLMKSGVKCIRLGKPLRVMPELRNMALDSQLESHPHYDKMVAQREWVKSKKNRLDYRKLRSAKDRLEALESEVMKEVIGKTEVICATCIGAGSERLDTKVFPLVVVDECTQAVEPGTLVSICKASKRVILLGDHCQLPPTIHSIDAAEQGLEVSMFERLVSRGLRYSMLRTQYRMHPDISSFPNHRFYGGKLMDGVVSKDRKMPWGFKKNINYLYCAGPEEGDGDTSKRNRNEAIMVVTICTNLIRAGDCKEDDIGVITPYTAQVKLIRKLMAQQRLSQMEVNSVDGFQGREKEIIVFSCVRSNTGGQVGFLKDWRRLNVAITRARRGLIIIGDSWTLQKDPTWKALIDTLKEKQGGESAIRTPTRYLRKGRGPGISANLTKMMNSSKAPTNPDINKAKQRKPKASKGPSVPAVPEGLPTMFFN